MCSSKEQGGKRCEYANAIRNIRRHVIQSHPAGLTEEQYAHAFNQEIAKTGGDLARHLAQRDRNYAWKPSPSKIIPPEFLNQLPPLGKIYSRDWDTVLQEMTPLYNSLSSALSEDQQLALQRYTVVGYQTVNDELRGEREYRYRAKKFGKKDEFRDQRIAREIELLDSCFRDAEPAKLEVPLYRYYQVPAGVTEKDFVNVLTQDGGLRDKGYVSTTLRPDHALASIARKRKRDSAVKHVMLEIWTPQGIVPGQPPSQTPTRHSASTSVQELESEILLPRDQRLRVVGTGQVKHQFEEEPIETRMMNAHLKGTRISVPLIRLVDESYAVRR